MFRSLTARFVANVCLQRATQFGLNTKQTTFPLIRHTNELLLVRSKYVTSGVKGRRGSKTPPKKAIEDDEEIDEKEEEDDEFHLKDR